MEEKSKPKVLIFQDDRFIRDIFVDKFVQHGFSVKGYEYPPENLVEEVIKEFADIIYMNIVMPYVDGYEAIKILKNDERTKNIPVIFVSNLGLKEEIEKGLSLGAANYFISANYSPSELIQEFKDFLIKSKKFTEKDFLNP